VPFAFGEADFHKTKGRDILSRSHNDLNTTEDNIGLTESFSTHPLSCIVHVWKFKISFEISKKGRLFFGPAWSKWCVTNP
jgi:hypothetical protein